VFGLFESGEAAKQAAEKLVADGVPAQATKTLTRTEYWKQMFM